MSVPSKMPLPEAAGTVTGLPVRPIVSFCLCNCAHFYAICSLFSYAGILSADMGWAEDRDHAGEIAGFLQSSNVLGRIPTSFIWGWFAMRFGLRTGLAFSMLSLIVGGAAFGFCTSATLAVLVRFVFFGMGNGWVTFFAPISIELGGAERQTEVVGICFAAGTLAQLLGPALGGWTYGVVDGAPAVIPSFIGTIFGIAALGSLWAWMPPMRPEASDAGANSRAAPDEPSPGLWEVLTTWPVPLLVLLRCLQGFLNFAFFEVVPLWAISSRPLGGLALSENVLGTIFAFSAVSSAGFMAVGIKRVTKAVGLRRAAVASNLVCALCFGFMPFLPSAALLMGVHAITNSCMGLLGASYIATVNNSLAPAQRSAVNGICVTFESLGKGVGPMSVAIAFAWTLSEWGFSGHGLVFFGMALLHVFLMVGTALLPESVEAKSLQCVATKLARSLPASGPEPRFLGASDGAPEELDGGRQGEAPARAPRLGGKARRHLGKLGQRGDDDALQERAGLVDAGAIPSLVQAELQPSSAAPDDDTAAV